MEADCSHHPIRDLGVKGVWVYAISAQPQDEVGRNSFCHKLSNYPAEGKLIKIRGETFYKVHPEIRENRCAVPGQWECGWARCCTAHVYTHLLLLQCIAPSPYPLVFSVLPLTSSPFPFILLSLYFPLLSYLLHVLLPSVLHVLPESTAFCCWAIDPSSVNFK